MIQGEGNTILIGHEGGDVTVYEPVNRKVLFQYKNFFSNNVVEVLKLKYQSVNYAFAIANNGLFITEIELFDKIIQKTFHFLQGEAVRVIYEYSYGKILCGLST